MQSNHSTRGNTKASHARVATTPEIRRTAEEHLVDGNGNDRGECEKLCADIDRKAIGVQTGHNHDQGKSVDMPLRWTAECPPRDAPEY